jgi:hypothetical protein
MGLAPNTICNSSPLLYISTTLKRKVRENDKLLIVLGSTGRPVSTEEVEWVDKDGSGIGKGPLRARCTPLILIFSLVTKRPHSPVDTFSSQWAGLRCVGLGWGGVAKTADRIADVFDAPLL